MPDFGKDTRENLPDFGSSANLPEASLLEAKLDQILRLVENVHAGGKAPWSAPWLTVHQAIEYASISDSTLRRLIASGRLTAYRPAAGSILIRREQLDNLIKSTAGKKSSRGRKKVVVGG